VIQLTGSGLKDLDAVKSISKFPRAIKPKLNEVEKFLEERKK
jgi:threonine synthase